MDKYKYPHFFKDGTLNFFSPQLAGALDCTQVSNQAATVMPIEVLKVLGHSSCEHALNSSTTQGQRKKIRKLTASLIK